jgi:hypothetical protein
MVALVVGGWAPASWPPALVLIVTQGVASWFAVDR